MLCENYRESLLNIAAGGECLTPEAEQHLASCNSCRSAFAGEQALFAAMDSGLRNLMSKEPSASLAARVRAEIGRELAQTRRFRFVWVCVPAAAFAALLLAVFSPKTLQDFHSGGVPVTLVVPGRTAPGAQNGNPLMQPERSLSVAREHRVHSARQIVLAAADESQIRVPPGQEAALVEYAALLQKKPELAAARAEDLTGEPLAIQPLNIAELPAQPLAIEPLGSEAPDSSR
jgi:hypothetical protein